MEELRQTVLAYYKDAPQHIGRSVDECFVEMNVDGNDRVSRKSSWHTWRCMKIASI
ncbi:uncharacterized protein Pyn_34905 [Prunus yedoensis var. nudiflora]|uniref:Uncharacterized protein n=1 Tax=Prunus yedoensis var. nudiflora TaxID=2094558 RepID=A0A314Y0I7_PRUYE|nr:uncharacterized protein Pyn_34905 [Prunus yedoensis var. nudiflora]